MHALAAHLHLVLQVGEAVGEIAGQNLAAALEHGNALSGARQPRGGNAAAIARADDDHVVAILEAIERARQSGHALMFPEVAESSRCAKARVASNAARCISRARRFHGNGAPHTAKTTAPPVRPAPAAHMRILIPFWQAARPWPRSTAKAGSSRPSCCRTRRRWKRFSPPARRADARAP